MYVNRWYLMIALGLTWPRSSSPGQLWPPPFTTHSSTGASQPSNREATTCSLICSSTGSAPQPLCSAQAVAASSATSKGTRSSTVPWMARFGMARPGSHPGGNPSQATGPMAATRSPMSHARREDKSAPSESPLV